MFTSVLKILCITGEKGHGTGHGPFAKRGKSIDGVAGIDVLVHVGGIHDLRGDDLHGVNGLAAEHAQGHIQAVLDHQGAVERGAGMDFIGLFLDDVEVFLASAAAGDGLDVGTAGILDGLQGADRGFVVEAVDSVDLRIGGQDCLLYTSPSPRD